jgi:hypothetical protein
VGGGPGLVSPHPPPPPISVTFVFPRLTIFVFLCIPVLFVGYALSNPCPSTQCLAVLLFSHPLFFHPAYLASCLHCIAPHLHLRVVFTPSSAPPHPITHIQPPSPYHHRCRYSVLIVLFQTRAFAWWKQVTAYRKCVDVLGSFSGTGNVQFD